MFAHLAVKTCHPALVRGEFKPRIGLGQHVLCEIHEIDDVAVCHRRGDGEQGVDLGHDPAVLLDAPDGAVVFSEQISDAVFNLLVRASRQHFEDVAIGM